MNARPTHVGYSWWQEEARTATADLTEAPPLVGDARADVAIVGGGYVGLWTALTLKRRDPSLGVVLLEAGVVGTGASGRNGGFLHGYWQQLPGLVRNFGRSDALALAEAGSAAQRAILEFATSAEVDFWPVNAGMLMVAANEWEEAAIDQALRSAESLGVTDQVVALSPAEVHAVCASPVFRRGILFQEAGTVQPARLVLALRRAVIAAGVRLHESSAVTTIDPGQPFRVRTALGVVRADEVVVATNAAFAEQPWARRFVVNMGSHIILTEPIPERLAAIGWVGGEGIRDGRSFLHYIRTTPDGRIAFGWGGGQLRLRRDAHTFDADPTAYEQMARDLVAMFPDLAGVGLSHAWGGHIDMASDHAPIVGTHPRSRIHFAVGLSGHGVNASWIAGQILASLVEGREDEWTALCIRRSSAPGLPPEPLRYLGGSAIRASILRVEQCATTDARAPIWARIGSDLPKRLGIRIGSRR